MTGIYAGEGVQLLPSDAFFEAALRDDDAVLLTAFHREMAVFLYGKNKRDELAVHGTGFIITIPVRGVPGTNWYYLVTAQHVVERIRCMTADHKIHIRANSQSSSNEMWDELPLDAFHFHPADPVAETGDAWLAWSDERRYDVAVALCPDKLINDAAVVAWPHTLLLTNVEVRKRYVGQGDELAIIGLYNRHPGRKRMTPIVRAGMIAAMPSDDLVASEIGWLRAYLIEARSTGGTSGSPVIRMAHPRAVTKDDSTVSLQVEYAILGMITSAFDSPASRADEWINEGIAVVTPSMDILATLEQEAIMSERARREPELRKASPDVSRMRSIDEPAGSSNDDRVSLDGVSPDDALRALLKTPPHAQTEDPA